MKTKLLLAFAICFCLISNTQAQTLPAYLPANGLVGWWPFNGNANDESGNGNDGTVNGSTLTADRFGVLNSAYGFDGLDDFINFNNNQSLIFNSADFTVGFWVKRSELTPIGSYDNGAGFNKWDHGNATPGANEFACSFSDLPGYENKFVIAVESSNSIFFTLSQTTIDDGNWFYVTGQRNGDSLKVYVNGLAEAATFIGDIIINNVGRDLLLATYSNNQINPGPINYTNAIFDDIAIYNRALSQEEITALYTGEPVNPPTACNPLPSNLQNGLVGYWPFCGNANDESGNGNDGTVNGATLTEDRFGMAEKAYSLEAGSNISTSYSPTDVVSTSYSAWFKTTNGGCIIGSNANNFSPNLTLAIHTNSTSTGNQGTALWVVDHAGSSVGWMSQQPANPLYNDNQWHHIVGIYNCPNGNTIQTNNLSLFVDGQIITTIEQNVNPSNSPINILSNLVFGMNQRWISQGFDGRFIGTLDDIGIWNRALTAEEVQELYTLNACTFSIYDTTFVTIYDTVSVSTTDTLIINTLITAVQPAQENTFLVYPNPTGSQITINNGNVSILGGYTMRISNSIGQEVYNQNITQTEVTLDLSNWGGNGLYVLYILDPQGEIIAVKQIVLQ